MKVYRTDWYIHRCHSVYSLGFPFPAITGICQGVDHPLTPQHGIPLVVIYVNETDADIAAAGEADPDHTFGDIQAMNKSEDHSVRALGDVEIIVPEGYTGEYGSTEILLGRVELGYIRGRGNSTWTEPKKPYKIHYQKAQDLFGMGPVKTGP